MFCKWQNLFYDTLLLPPATKLGQSNIFTSVCQEFCPRGGVCPIACWDTPPEPEVDTPRHSACWQIRQQAGGTHPTGMHTCFKGVLSTHLFQGSVFPF